MHPSYYFGATACVLVRFVYDDSIFDIHATALTCLPIPGLRRHA